PGAAVAARDAAVAGRGGGGIVLPRGRSRRADANDRDLPAARLLDTARRDHATGVRGHAGRVPARGADHAPPPLRRRRGAAAGGLSRAAHFPREWNTHFTVYEPSSSMRSPPSMRRNSRI